MVAAKKSDEKFGHNLARDFGDSNQSCTVSAGALTETGCALPTSLKCRVCFFYMKYNLKMFANHQEMSHHLTLSFSTKLHLELQHFDIQMMSNETFRVTFKYCDNVIRML